MEQKLKRFLRSLTPKFVLEARRRVISSRARAAEDKRFQEFRGLPADQAFAKVYEEGVWGKSDGDDFYSGTGSHRDHIVTTYVAAVEGFLTDLGHKPDVVDLGCGDFSVGSAIRPLCGRYIAGDVVESLIARNKSKFADLQVDFRVVNIIDDELPEGEVVFIRQVLQHLSNDDIAKVVAKLPGRFRYLVLSEHLPDNPAFRPNIDMPRGPQIRLGLSTVGSGVVLTEAPFFLRPRREQVLCEIKEDVGFIRTTLYEL
jgi:hypothetical protein